MPLIYLVLAGLISIVIIQLASHLKFSGRITTKTAIRIMKASAVFFLIVAGIHTVLKIVW